MYQATKIVWAQFPISCQRNLLLSLVIGVFLRARDTWNMAKHGCIKLWNMAFEWALLLQLWTRISSIHDMSYGQNLVHGEGTSLSRVGPYLSILFWSCLILSDAHMKFYGGFTNINIKLSFVVCESAFLVVQSLWATHLRDATWDHLPLRKSVEDEDRTCMGWYLPRIHNLKSYRW